MEKLTGLCVLLAALSLAVTGEKVTVKNFKDGDSLTLDVSPPYSDNITNILWDFRGNLLAEWIKDKVPLEFYRSFKGRTTLDTKNGRLVVNNMSKNDTGVYSVEINDNVHGESYTATLMKSVPQPVVVISPLNCTSSSEVCTVSCDGDTREAEPVNYRWDIGDWELLGKNIKITEKKNGKHEFITCRMSNLLGEKVSETVHNPFYREDETWKLVLGIVLGVLLLGGAVWLMWKRKKGPFKNRGAPRTDPANIPPTPAVELNLLNDNDTA